jgi:hypothetical protein
MDMFKKIISFVEGYALRTLNALEDTHSVPLAQNVFFRA